MRGCAAIPTADESRGRQRVGRSPTVAASSTSPHAQRLPIWPKRLTQRRRRVRGTTAADGLQGGADRRSQNGGGVLRFERGRNRHRRAIHSMRPLRSNRRPHDRSKCRSGGRANARAGNLRRPPRCGSTISAQIRRLLCALMPHGYMPNRGMCGGTGSALHMCLLASVAATHRAASEKARGTKCLSALCLQLPRY